MLTEEQKHESIERYFQGLGLDGSTVKSVPRLGEELILVTRDGNEVNAGQVISCQIATQRSDGRRGLWVMTSKEGRLFLNLPASLSETIPWIEGPAGNDLYRRI